MTGQSVPTRDTGRAAQTDSVDRFAMGYISLLQHEHEVEPIARQSHQYLRVLFVCDFGGLHRRIETGGLRDGEEACLGKISKRSAASIGGCDGDRSGSACRFTASRTDCEKCLDRGRAFSCGRCSRRYG